MDHRLLSARLNAVAELVPACDKLADIGTDHGFLPLYLLSSGKIRRAVCTDVNASPLESAKRNLAAAGLSGLAEFRLGDGMKVIEPGEISCAVIAGMGGETIAGLMGADTSGTELFVLQPMSKSEKLRQWLHANGWGIPSWRLVRDVGRLYEVLLVSKKVPPEAEPFVSFGAPCPEVSRLYSEYIGEKLAGFEKSLRGLLSAASPDAERISIVQREIETLRLIRSNYPQR